MRRAFLISVLVGLLAMLIVRTRADEASKNPAVAEEPKLDQPLGELRIDMPFDKALDRLRTLTRANIIVDWPALEAAGYHRDTPIQLHLFDLPLQKVLDLVLVEARRDGGSGPLGFRVDDRDERIIRVSTREALDNAAVARLYDVRDLVDEFFPKVMGADGKLIETQTPAERIEALVMLMKGNVAVDTWRDYGGTIGRIRADSGFLFVSQTSENQRSIELILYNLRKIVAARKAGEKPTTRGIDLLAPPTTEPVKQ